MRPVEDLTRPTEIGRLRARIVGATALRLTDVGHGLLRQHTDTINAALVSHAVAAHAGPLASATRSPAVTGA